MVEHRADPLAQLTGDSPEMAAVRERLGRVLERQSDARRVPPILILGETGTGKGLLARALHGAGPRAAGQFVDVNCAAIPEAMLEAEMFGFERGAFTDARQAKPGLFQTAHRGTLFLDEVGLLPLSLQGKLLKAIEEQAVRPLGSTRSQPADVWILSATSEDLTAAIRDRRFREDLYHRLALLTVSLPPLRERGQDVLLIARHFLARACADYGLPSRELTPDACVALLAYAWPGNVRELANVMERVALLSDASNVSAEALGLPRPGAPPPPDTATGAPSPLLEDAMARVERDHLVAALEQTRWNITHAAADLGISRDTLRYRIAKHGLEPPTVSPTRRPRKRPPATPARPLPEPAATPVVSWNERRLALLRVALGPEVAGDPPARASHALGVIAEKVRAFGGAVQEWTSSAIVAAFGLEPIEDAPRRAAHAALAIRRAAERVREAGERQALVRMAIEVGPFRVGQAGAAVEIESEAKRTAWAILEAMVAVAEPEGILTGDSAYPSLERRFELATLGRVTGVPGQVHRVVGHTRSELEIGWRIAPFVGRGQALDLLGAGLRSATAGKGQAIGIVGEAGMGKSRLLFEFRRRLEESAIAHLGGHCLSYAGATPYLPLIEILRQTFGITDADTPATIAAQVRSGLDDLGLDSTGTAPYLLQLLDAGEGTGPLAGLSPEAIKARTFETLRQVYVRRAHRQPLVVVVEDLHWIDPTSEEWLVSLVESLPRAPMLLLVSYRPGYHPPWIDRSDATQLSLGALDRDESMRIIESIAPALLPEALARSVVDRASGNPFFLEELCRSLVEQNGMSAAVPDTIQDVLRVRIDRLADEPRHLLQIAAVVGRTGRMALLHALWNGPGAPATHLRTLARLEFLYEEGSGEQADYLFKHALVQEVAYDSLPPARRQALHAAAARALEALHASRLDDIVDRLAYHYSRASEADRAVTWLGRLADKAARAFAHIEAVQAVEEALGHVERLPAGDRDRHLFTLILRWVGSLTYLGRFEEIVATLLRHRERLERFDDPAVTGRYFFWLARTYSVLGDPARTVEHARRALAEATRCGDEATTGKAHFALAYECFWSGRPAEGVERAREAVAHMERTDEQRWVADSYWVLGINHAALGDLGEALEAHGRQQALADAIGDPRLRCSSILSTGSVHALLGEWDRAIEICRHGLGLSPDPVHRALGMGFLGAAHLEKGETAEAIPLLEQAAQSYAQFRVRQTQGWFTALLGEAYLQRGDAERARAAATVGLEIVTTIGYRWGIGWAQRILGRIALASGLVPEAERQLDAALATFTAMGARYDIARTQLDLARLTHRRDDREAAAAHLQAARQLFSALRIPRYVETTSRLAEELHVFLRS